MLENLNLMTLSKTHHKYIFESTVIFLFPFLLIAIDLGGFLLGADFFFLMEANLAINATHLTYVKITGHF
ncbi:MAG: hypothetical protein AB8B69_20045 [Chitinophagales bacterium]